jgi:predicted transcriptional regulator of viral defense system
MALEITIKEEAQRNHGIVTTGNIISSGFSESALRQYARRHPDKIEKLGSGIYLFLDFESETNIDFDNSTFLTSLALAGPESYLTGSSVLDYYNLANANPAHIAVRTPRKFRRVFPSWLRVSYTKKRERIDIVNDIRLQNLANAFKDAKDTRIDYRLQGVDDAEERNLIGGDDADETREYLRKQFGR